MFLEHFEDKSQNVILCKCQSIFIRRSYLPSNTFKICGALRDLVPFEQFKKRELQPATLPKLTFLHGCFLNCANGTKSSNASHTVILCFQFVKYNMLRADEDG